MGAVGLALADKHVSGKEDRKMLNVAVGAGALTAAGIFGTHKFVEDQVRPELRILNTVGVKDGESGGTCARRMLNCEQLNVFFFF